MLIDTHASLPCRTHANAHSFEGVTDQSIISITRSRQVNGEVVDMPFMEVVRFHSTIVVQSTTFYNTNFSVHVLEMDGQFYIIERVTDERQADLHMWEDAETGIMISNAWYQFHSTPALDTVEDALACARMLWDIHYNNEDC